MKTPRLTAPIEIRSSATFADGLLLELIGAIRRTPEGGLFALEADERIKPDLEAWSRMTGNAIVGVTREPNGVRWVVRHGHARVGGSSVAPRELGSRLWLYTNFDCNLACDYCCVRSSPTAPRRALGLETVRRLADEAPSLGVEEFFVTGGEPMMLDDIGEILRSLTVALPTTVLTNGALLKGSRLESLASLPRERLTFQISVDSPTPELHDLHRGKGTWERALRGVDALSDMGFRVRLAATVSSDEQETSFVDFLDRRGVRPEDRVIRRIALRGSAADGLVLSKVDVVPEITVTAEGVFWHPVGAEDEDLLVTPQVFPLARAFDLVRELVAHHKEHGQTLASVFHCA